MGYMFRAMRYLCAAALFVGAFAAPARTAAPEVGAGAYSPQSATAHWVEATHRGRVYFFAGGVKVTTQKGGELSYAYVGRTLCDTEIEGGTLDQVCEIRTHLVDIPNRNFQIDRLLRTASLNVPNFGKDHEIAWVTSDDLPVTHTGASWGFAGVSGEAGVSRAASAKGTLFGRHLRPGKRNGRLYEGADAQVFVRGIYEGAPVVLRWHP